MYFFYHSDCYRTVSKSVVFIPVHDTWKVNKNTNTNNMGAGE